MTRARSFLNGVGECLLGPHPAITGDRERLGAHLFAGLMLVHLGLVSVLVVVTNYVWLATSGHDIWQDKDAWTVLAGLAVIALAYGLLRAGRDRLALPLYIAATVVVPMTAPFVPDPNAEIGLIATAFIPVLLASVAYSFRGTFLVLVLVVAGSTIQLIRSDMPARQKGTGFSLVVAVAVAGGVLMAIRRHQAGLEERRLEQVRASEAESLRLADQLNQSVKMESIGRLAGGVAHDFNNLLTAIIGNAELAAADLPQGSPEAACVEQVVKAANSAAALTRQLLAFSRKQLIAPRRLDLNELVAHTRAMVARLIGEDVALTVETDGALWPVRADASLIEQSLVNLAVNARDAMPDGGALRIRTANAVIDAAGAAAEPELQPGEYATITVADTGTGMSPEVRARIFEPFFTTKPKGRGTGLGLATTYGAVKQSGGHILVESEPGRGTTFRVFLPRMAGEAQADAAPAAARWIPRGSETVMVVEDDEDVRALASRTLESLGYRVVQAASGEEALEMARARPVSIDLLLTDVVMSGMNGRQVADRIAPIHPRCRVLFTSGYTDEAIVHHGVLDEGIAFLAKPYTSRALGLKVREVLDQTRLPPIVPGGQPPAT